MTTLTVEDVSQESEDDDTPIIATPKPPADQPLKDDNSLLAVRSKLFYKKNQSYVELGNYIAVILSIKCSYRSWSIESERGAF